MKRSVLVFLGACIVAVAIFWRFTEHKVNSQNGATSRLDGVSSRLPATTTADGFGDHSNASSHELRDNGESNTSTKAELGDPSTYAASRLADIKAAPAKWNNAETWKKEFASAKTPEMQREVLGLARQLGDASLLAILPKALASNDLLVRLDAARSIAGLHEVDLPAGIAAGVSAPDPEMRKEVMDIVAQTPAERRTPILQQSLNSAYPDVQLRAVQILSDSPNPQGFSVLIEGMLSQSEETRGAATAAIQGIVHQRFQTYQQAAQWWGENRSRYDEMMLQIAGSPN